ncbi:Do family serine endopeptidase [Pelagibius sp. Alg239-R121]|uniref:Do family serine endopeptidase n=1 Tax=Pelagibius sp. Alg239-R121 TaxID=2993448 RepID=UPI0024A60DE3|nr:Do family serine endopeptidase [Pelagibius sp. Alg239-R121]
MTSASIAYARPAPESFADLVEEVSPAVVNIATITERDTGTKGSSPEGRNFQSPFPEGHPFNDFFEKFTEPRQFGNRSGPNHPQAPSRKVSGAGSGFIIDAEGYVVTNSHVVNEADKIKITLRDGQSYDAELIGEDPTTDLALLKIETDTALPFVEFGNSDTARVGDWVLTVGNPFGLGGSVTAGIISARGRDLPGGTLIDFLQLDAPINPGNSGGPAFNSNSKVIGVNTAIFSPNGGNVGIGFAIPAKLAAAVIDDLRDDGKVDRSWLGVRIQGVTEDIAKGFGLENSSGALVAAVEDGSPAASADLQRGDIILQWGDTTIGSVNDLPRAVAFTPVGKTLEIKVWREKEIEILSVTTAAPAEREALASAEKTKPENRQHKFEDTGITLSDLTPDLRTRFHVDEEAAGVLVIEVEAGSEAEEKGVQPGDVILSVGLDPVASVEELASEIQSLQDEKVTVVTLGVQRNDQESFVALKLSAA